jgi:ATP-dependent helicase/nuclease subunit B
MENKSFLEHLVDEVLLKFQNNIQDCWIVLPTKRARVFLLDALQSKISAPIMAPKIISIEDFVQELSGIQKIDSVALLFEFYHVYLNHTKENEIQPLEQFSHWAKMLLQDFNEIDRYLLDPTHVFSYLKDIESLKRWNLEASSKTNLIENQLYFWNQMPVYYQAFYDFLKGKKKGYQGMIYREAISNLKDFSKNLKENQIVFAGFNALNQAEEQLIQYLLSEKKAAIYWDTEATFLEDPYHDAGLFARRMKSEWKHYKTNPYEWIFNHYESPKKIQIIGTAKAIGQAKIVGDLVSSLTQNHELKKIAIILGDEQLLIPVLFALPDSVNQLNITMGYSAVHNPAQLLIQKLFKLHQTALSRGGKNYVFYYKHVLDVLNNPLVEPFIDAHTLAQIIRQNNYTFIPHTKLEQLFPDRNPFFKLLFDVWSEDAIEVLQRLKDVLLQIKVFISESSENQSVVQTFVFSVFKVLNQLTNYCMQYPYITHVDLLFTLYKQIIDLAEVSFEGEPLQGLQLMGVLESRVLDFETVIVTSVNEGTFPAGKSQNSFIPLDVKRELGLPTFKEKDAIYTYHFYHILQRAKNVYLLYNTESDGIDAGEKSRFITQLMVEPSNHEITHEIYNPIIPDKPHQLMEVKKSELAMERIVEIAQSGFSPSSLTTYIRNPMQFYFQRLLRISDVDEVEENIALNTLGTIIHGALEDLYGPLLNKILTVSDLKEMIQNIDSVVMKQFKLVYKEGEITKGKNLLAFEVAKRNVFHFLNYELKSIEDGNQIEVLFLEKTFERVLEHPILPFPVKIKGNVDRIEKRNGVFRIIDYKTGKVETKNLWISHWDGLTLDLKNDKIIQLLCYAFMFLGVYPNQEMEVGIFSFKNMKAGFMPFTIKEGRTVITQIVDSEVMESFVNELAILLSEIVNPEIDFIEKEV